MSYITESRQEEYELQVKIKEELKDRGGARADICTITQIVEELTHDDAPVTRDKFSGYLV